MDISSIDRSTFDTTFENDIATALQIPSSRVSVVAVTPGSVIVTFDLLADATSALSPQVLLTRLNAQVADKSSALYSGTLTQNTLETKELCLDNVYRTSCGGGGSSSSEDDSTPIIVGVIVPVVVLAAGAGGFWFYRRKSGYGKVEPAEVPPPLPADADAPGDTEAPADPANAALVPQP
jgi:hypothetical protein